MNATTITMLIGFLALVAGQVTGFASLNKRFDEAIRQMGNLRERMAGLERSLDGFFAGRRDRGAA